MTEEKIEKAELDASVGIWICTVGSFPIMMLEILSRIIGYEYVPAFIFVAVTYMFMAMFIFMIYKPKQRLKIWIRKKTH